MKQEKFRALTIVAGVLLSVAVLCSNIFHISDSVKAAKTASTEKAKEEKEAAFFTAPTITPPAASNVQLDVPAICLFEIICEDDSPEVFDDEDVCRTQRYLTTLFRFIISPNAP